MKRLKPTFKHCHFEGIKQIKAMHISWPNRYQTYQQDDYYERMRVISRRYDEIDKESTQYQNRLQSLLHLSFPEIDEVFKTKA